MAKIGFHLNKSKEDKNHFVPIRAKISVESKARYKSMDKIKARYWNRRKQRVYPNRETEPYNRHKEINLLLDEYEKKAKDFFNYCLLNGIPLTLKMVEDFFKGKAGDKRISKIGFNEAFEKYIESGKLTWEPNTIKNYITAKNYVFEFQKNTGIKLTFENIDFQFWDEFVKYSYQQRSNFLMIDSKEKYLKVLRPNTLAKYRSVLVSFLVWANERGYYNGTDHVKFKAPEHDIDIIYLTEAELDQLYLHKFKNERLERVRDIFVFGCYTGLRYSDLMDLKQDHIYSDLIKKTTIKTNKAIEVPLLPMAKDIIDKYKDSFHVLPQYSDVKLNKYIKECCEIANIKTPFTISIYPGNKRQDITKPKYKFIVVHTARKTFINLAHKYDIPEGLIMDIVGQSEYRTFMKYRKYEPEKKKKDMNNAFKKYADRLQKEKYKQPKA